MTGDMLRKAGFISLPVRVLSGSEGIARLLTNVRGNREFFVMIASNSYSFGSSFLIQSNVIAQAMMRT
jgi:hypothetical protein